jgi:hypothetical protein
MYSIQMFDTAVFRLIAAVEFMEQKAVRYSAA